jgi:hypothetical protein
MSNSNVKKRKQTSCCITHVTSAVTKKKTYCKEREREREKNII